MSLRERLNRSPALQYSVPGVIVLIVLWSLWAHFGASQEVNRGWFTVDDGKTYFADDVNKLPPFQKDGKTAYGCEVFTCDNGKTTFVGFLVRYRPGAAAEIAALGPQPRSGQALQEYLDRRNAIEIHTREVKLPLTGDTGWALARASPEGAAITTIKCSTPGGDPQSVLP